MKFLSKAWSVFDRIIEIFAAFTALIIILLMLMICADVFMRFFFNKPISGVTEISEYCLLYITFLAATWLLKDERHVKIDILLQMSSPRKRALINFATSVICAIACLILVWYGSTIILEHIRLKIRLSTILMPPSYIIIGIIPFGYLLLFIQLLRRSYQFLKESQLGQRKQAPTSV